MLLTKKVSDFLETINIIIKTYTQKHTHTHIHTETPTHIHQYSLYINVDSIILFVLKPYTHQKTRTDTSNAMARLREQVGSLIINIIYCS